MRAKSSFHGHGLLCRRPALGAGASVEMAWGPFCCWDQRWERSVTGEKKVSLADPRSEINDKNEIHLQ